MFTYTQVPPKKLQSCQIASIFLICILGSVTFFKMLRSISWARQEESGDQMAHKRKGEKTSLALCSFLLHVLVCIIYKCGCGACTSSWLHYKMLRLNPWSWNLKIVSTHVVTAKISSCFCSSFFSVFRLLKTLCILLLHLLSSCLPACFSATP